MEAINEDLIEVDEHMSDTESIYSTISLENSQDTNSEDEEYEFIEDITDQMNNFGPYLSELVENNCTHNWLHRQGRDSKPCF